MDKQILELLEKFSDFIDFDPDKKSYKISFGNTLDDYEMNKRMKRIVELQNYDETGSIQLLYAQHMLKEFLKEQKVSLYDILEDEESLLPIKELWGDFNTPFIKNIKSNFIDKVNELVKRLMSNKAIGKYRPLKEGSILRILSNSLEDIFNLKIESYSSGSTKSTNLSIATTILVYPSLKDALKKLSFAPNGIYVAYIGDTSLAGWFSIFIKDGDNLVSFNERYDFKYPDQLNSMRNGRQVANGKADGIFPYNYIFEYGDYNYKGYATDIQIQEDKLAFFNLNYSVYLPLLMTMLLVKGYYLNNDISKNKVYSLPLMLEMGKADNTSLVELNSNHALSKVYNETPLRDFKLKEVLETTALAKEFEFDSDKKNYDANMRTNHCNDHILDIYKDSYDEKKRNSLTKDSIDLISSQDFVGTQERVDMLQYWIEREGLANHIKNELEKDFEAAGGLEGLQEYFRKLIEDNKEQVMKSVVSFNRENNYKLSFKVGSINTNNPKVTVYEGNINGYGALNIEKNPHLSIRDVKCPITNTPITVGFRCEINSYGALETLLGKDNLVDIPKVLKSWQKDKKQTGNSILDMIDPVDLLKHPINKEHRDSHSPFIFRIVFSKRGYAKYCEDNGIEIDKFWLK